MFQGLNNAVALDFHYAEQMIYWTDVTTQGSMIRRMNMNGSNIEVSEEIECTFNLSYNVSKDDWSQVTAGTLFNHSSYLFPWTLCKYPRPTLWLTDLAGLTPDLPE